MNLKAFIIAGLALSSLTSEAALISRIYKYIHTSGKVVELQGINEAKGTAYYFDYALGKRVAVNLSDVSKETKKTINGVKAGDFVFTYTDTGAQVCTTYTVFENGMAHLGCRTGAYLNTIGPARFQVASYTGHTENLKAPVKEVDGFSVGEKVRLNGKNVKIKVVFESGYALVEPASILAKLDTSSDLLKTNVKIVTTKDIEKL